MRPCERRRSIGSKPSEEGLSALRRVAQAQRLVRPGETGLGALRDHPSLGFRERGIDVKREVVAVAPQGGGDEVHLVLHKPGNEVDVARQAIEPRNDQRTAQDAR